MDQIGIQNLTRMSKIFVLPHSVCKKIGKCLCKKGNPFSLHIPSGKMVETYKEVLELKDIQRAIEKRQIAVRQLKKKVAEADGKAPAKPKSEGFGSGSKKKKTLAKKEGSQKN